MYKMNIIPSPSLAGLTVIVDQAVLLASVHHSFKPSQNIFQWHTLKTASCYSGGTALALHQSSLLSPCGHLILPYGIVPNQSFSYTSTKYLYCQQFTFSNKMQPFKPKTPKAVCFEGLRLFPWKSQDFQRMKFVNIFFSRSGSSRLCFPAATIFMSQAILLPSTRMICWPSWSCKAAPGAVPWMTFQ